MLSGSAAGCESSSGSCVTCRTRKGACKLLSVVFVRAVGNMHFPFRADSATSQGHQAKHAWLQILRRRRSVASVDSPVVGRKPLALRSDPAATKAASAQCSPHGMRSSSGTTRQEALVRTRSGDLHAGISSRKATRDRRTMMAFFDITALLKISASGVATCQKNIDHK